MLVEQALRDLLDDELAALGHTVHTARDGVTALDLVDQSALRPDVLVTDLSMPRLGGIALSARLRERWPALPVVLVSGHGESQQAARNDPKTMLLAKPFAVESSPPCRTSASTRRRPRA